MEDLSLCCPLLFPGFCLTVMAMYNTVGVSPKAKFDIKSLGAELLQAKLLSPPKSPMKPLIVENMNNNSDSGGGKATTTGPNTARCETRSVALHEALVMCT